jgi:hypothetical protein
MLYDALSRRVGKGASSRRAHHFNDRTALREWWARHRLARSRDPLALPALRFFTPSESGPHQRSDMRVMPERTPISLRSSGLRLLISLNLALSMPLSRTRFRTNHRSISVRKTSGANIRGTVLCIASSSVELLLHLLNVENCVH